MPVLELEDGRPRPSRSTLKFPTWDNFREIVCPSQTAPSRRDIRSKSLSPVRTRPRFDSSVGASQCRGQELILFSFCFISRNSSYSPGHVQRGDPGVSRSSLPGPDYATTDMRLTRRFYAGDRVKLELTAESFNLLNRDNVPRSRRMVFRATRPSSYKPIRPLESISSRLNTACHPAFFGPPTHTPRGRYNSL